MNENDRKVMFSSKQMDWQTPLGVFHHIERRMGRFDMDAAANESNHLCDRWIGPGGEWEDALTDRPWEGNKIWLNPPYGRNVGEWVKRAWVESRMVPNRHVCVLIFARTDTKWWHEWAMRAGLIELIEGRLTFHRHGIRGDAAPAPSALLHFGNHFSPFPHVCSTKLAPEDRR